jgi:L-threonylcarbamoyladenylate synthase
MSGSFVFGGLPLGRPACYRRAMSVISSTGVDAAPTSGIVPADPENIATAARRLAAGELVAFPTETVYGLGGDATNDRAVARIFAVKARPRFNPLIVHFADAAQARTHVAFDRRADILAAALWPGALTLVLPRLAESSISLLASAGLPSLAVRVPGHAVARALLEACAVPIAAPSANASGKLSPTTAGHVAQSLGGSVAMILDGGPCPIGIESTVIDLTGATPALLRSGGIAEERIAALVGPLSTPEPTGSRFKSPGMLESHYAPELPLRLDAGAPRPGEALLAFGPDVPAGAAVCANLSPSGDVLEAATNLFAMLRTLDQPGLAGIAVMPIPEAGLGRAINDRLRRAAAPRPA